MSIVYDSKKKFPRLRIYLTAWPCYRGGRYHYHDPNICVLYLSIAIVDCEQHGDGNAI